MTNESDTYAQAEPGKAPGSTFERKEMSFKTLRKRIALVAVAALAVTGLSTVPANAAAQDGPELTAINVKAATANTNVVNTELSIFVGGSATGTDLDNTETINFAAALTTFPTGGFVAGVREAGRTHPWPLRSDRHGHGTVLVEGPEPAKRGSRRVANLLCA